MSITHTGAHWVLVMKKEPNGDILGGVGLWLLGTVVMSGVVLYGVLTDATYMHWDALSMLLVMLVPQLFLLHVFFWNLRGREKVVIGDSLLRIVKEGGLFTTSRTFELNLIDDVTCAKGQLPGWLRRFGLHGGGVAIVYMEQEKYFGQSINKAEAQNIADLIKAQINASINTTQGNE